MLASAGSRFTRSSGWVWHRDLPGPPILLPPHEGARYLDISPIGKWVATGSHWGTKVKISCALSGELIHELPVEEGSNVRFSLDGRWLATGGGCRLWTVGSWQEAAHIA